MEWLEEGCLVVDDRGFAAALEARWRLDLSRSRQATGARAALGEASQGDRAAAHEARR